MANPALQQLGSTGNTMLELSVIHLGSDDLSESLRRDRAGVSHDRYGVTVASRTWKQARVWNLNINSANQAYIESLRDFFEAGSFYLYPDSSDLLVKYTVYWSNDSFAPTYVSPNKYALQATFKETTIGAGTPTRLSVGGDQTVTGNLTVTGNEILGGSLSVAGSETVTGNLSVSGSLTVTGSVSMPNLTFDSVKSNGDVFVNYNGGEGNSRVWFYDGGSTSGASLWWNDSEQYLTASKSFACEGLGSVLGKGQGTHVQYFCDEPQLLYTKASHTMMALYPWNFTSSLNVAGTSNFQNTVSGISFYAKDGAPNYKAFEADDSTIWFRPSTAFGSNHGIKWISSTGNTEICRIGLMSASGGSYTHAQYGFIGYGDSPHTNAYMKWIPSGITNEGRLTITAPSFYITPAVEGTSWIRTQNDMLCRIMYVNQAAGSDGVIQFSGSNANTTLPRLTYMKNGNAFVFNRGLSATTITATTFYSGSTPMTAAIEGIITAAMAPYTEIDHGTLVGLSDDDHTQYLTSGRAETWLTGNSHTSIAATTYSGISYTKSMTLLDVRADERIPLFHTQRAIVIDSTFALVSGASASVTWQLNHGSAITAATLVNSATTTNVTTGDVDVSMVSGSVPANSVVWVATSATGGTAAQLHLTVGYREV